MDGLRPVVEIMFMDFLFLAFDQLLNGAAKLHYIYDGQVRIPLVVRAPGGAKGGYGASHSQTLTAHLYGVPGITVVAPSDPRSARGLLKAAIRSDNPVVFVESKTLYPLRGETPDEEEVIPLGRAAVAREGDGMTLAGIGAAVPMLLQAARIMAEGGFSAEVVDLRSVSPMDTATVVASLRKTRRLLIAEEGHRFGGVGAELAAFVAQNHLDLLDAPIGRVGAAHVPIPAAPELEKLVLPDVNAVLAEARRMLDW
jgi:pyruvate dehydrogenase E1 component beta subunit